MPQKGERMSEEHRAKIASALTRPVPKFKVCPRCTRRRRASSFRKRQDGRTLNSYCWDCEKRINREKSKRHYHAHPEKKEENAEKYRRAALKRNYGITVEDYNALLASQGGGCAICGAESPGHARHNKYLAVDHDHDTGRIRGLLCHRCNRGIGLLGDDADRLARAAAYVRR